MLNKKQLFPPPPTVRSFCYAMNDTLTQFENNQRKSRIKYRNEEKFHKMLWQEIIIQNNIKRKQLHKRYISIRYLNCNAVKIFGSTFLASVVDLDIFEKTESYLLMSSLDKVAL